MKRRKLAAAALLLLAVAWTAFILGNSLVPGEGSAVQSGKVAVVIRGTMPSIKTVPQINWLNNLVRKLAHIFEFALLAGLVWGVFMLRTASKRNSAVCALLLAAAVAATDECLQYFTPGRSAELRDWAIDFAGAAAAVLLCTAVLVTVKALRRRAEAKKAAKAA